MIAAGLDESETLRRIAGALELLAEEAKERLAGQYRQLRIEHSCMLKGLALAKSARDTRWYEREVATANQKLEEFEARHPWLKQEGG